jgi:hypothetical protein
MSNIAFSLPALNQSYTLDICGSLLSAAPDAMTDVSAVATYHIKTSALQAVFKYYSDSADVNNVDASDIRYYVFMNQWPTDASLNPAHALMSTTTDTGYMLATGGDILNNKNLVKHDYVRFLAYKLFNTVYGVDLFNNELELLNDISSKGRTAKDSIMTALNNVSTASATGTTIASGQTDASGNRFTLNDDSGNTNICRELMRQIAANAPARFNDATFNDASGNPYRTVPIIDDDSINFKLTVNAASNQHLLTGRPSAIEPRVYKIRLIASSSTNVTPVDGTDTDLLDYIGNA